MKSNSPDKAFEYPLKIEVLWREEPQLIVTLVKLDKIQSELVVDTPHLLVPKSLYPENITIKTFQDFLETRLPDKTRTDMPYILRRYGLRFFNPIQMCMKSHGRNMTDFIWLRFDDEELTFNDIRLR